MIGVMRGNMEFLSWWRFCIFLMHSLREVFKVQALRSKQVSPHKVGSQTNPCQFSLSNQAYGEILASCMYKP